MPRRRIEGDIDIARRPFRAPPTKQEGPLTNEAITASQVQLIDDTGDNRGIVSIEDALALAAEAGLDLVEISPNQDPPVCKILDFGRYKYQAQKKAAEARKKQKTVDVKEIKMRPNIDTHDYEVKMRNARRFLDDGDKVKLTIRFRGRELAHQDRGLMVLERIREDLDDRAKVEQTPKMEGRMMTMVVAPK